MHVRESERGSALVLIIGVIAALAILAAALVMLTGNSQSNTARDRQRTQSFNLAEAALDAGLSKLAGEWPFLSEQAPAVDPAAFWGSFNAKGDIGNDYAAPRNGGARTQVVFFDNSDTNGDGVVGFTKAHGWDAGYDADGDKQIYVEAQGNVGRMRSRIRALVRMTYLNLGLLENVAIYTPGWVSVNSSAGVTAEVLAPGSDVASVYAFDVVGNGAVSQQIVEKIGQAWPVEDMITPEMLDYLKTVAKSRGTYYAYKNGSWPKIPDTAWGGVVYLDGPSAPGGFSFPSSVKDTHTGDGVGVTDPVTNEVLGPGVIVAMVSDLKWQSNAPYYGLIYCSGTINLQGTPQIHGIVVSASGSRNPPAVDVSGDYSIRYNDNVRQNLNQEFPLNVKTVANTWQEINPK